MMTNCEPISDLFSEPTRETALYRVRLLETLHSDNAVTQPSGYLHAIESDFDDDDEWAETRVVEPSFASETLVAPPPVLHAERRAPAGPVLVALCVMVVSTIVNAALMLLATTVMSEWGFAAAHATRPPKVEVATKLDPHAMAPVAGAAVDMSQPHARAMPEGNTQGRGSQYDRARVDQDPQREDADSDARERERRARRMKRRVAPSKR
jgi:hypothetical protein